MSMRSSSTQWMRSLKIQKQAAVKALESPTVSLSTPGIFLIRRRISNTRLEMLMAESLTSGKGLKYCSARSQTLPPPSLDLDAIAEAKREIFFKTLGFYCTLVEKGCAFDLKTEGEDIGSAGLTDADDPDSESSEPESESDQSESETRTKILPWATIATLLADCPRLEFLVNLWRSTSFARRWRRILSREFALLFSATISARSDKSVVEMLRAGLLAAFVSLSFTKVESGTAHTSPNPSCIHGVLLRAFAGGGLNGIHMAVKTKYDSGEYASAQACDHMASDSAHVSLSAMFRLCKALHCSEECQVVDWRADGHRAICASFRTLSRPDPISTRDRAFMRLLFHHGYELGRHAVLKQQIIFMHQNPDTDFYTRYDYRVLPPGHIVPLRELPPGPTGNAERDPMWADSVERASKSGGRMEAHIYRLRAIASEIRPGADLEYLSAELGEKVEALLRETQDVVQIHCD
ncbi:hypothetical protein C8R44DRAFT_731503 [Mycena epipterygia]|nr:hypothetical protein C8R44DRAFT_731503 [Mycena epipterygia]